MAALDVSDAFDADFISSFVVIRRTQSINDKGRAVDSERAFSAEAVVMMASPDDLARLPEGQYMNKAISITGIVRLQGPSPGMNADKILWHGSEYVIVALDDYTNFGFGFTHAVAVSMDTDPPPMPDPMGRA